MTGEAFASEIRRCFVSRWLHMRIVTGNATHSILACAIAFTQRHRVIVLDMVCRGRGFPRWWNHQNRQSLVQWTPWADIFESLSRLENPHIACLMASHADVVGEIRGKSSGIDDFGLSGNGFIGWCACFPRRNACDVHGLHMGGARAMAFFATDGQF